MRRCLSSGARKSKMTALENPAILCGTKIVSVALNAPGPAAAARLTQLGAEVTKIEPPKGDATNNFAPEWYAELCAGQHVLRLDLKDAAGRRQLDALLADANLLLASFRA